MTVTCSYRYGSRRRTCFACSDPMRDLPAYRRVRRDDLISRWWPLQALTRMTLPLPVTPIRFWAALWLFILGTVAYSPDVTGSGAGVLSVVFLGSPLATATGALA